MGYNQRVMEYRWLILSVLMLSLASPALAQDAHYPAETVEAHFQAILAEEYTQADEFFSAAFRRAFKVEQRAQIDNYYLTRKEQLAPGYEVVDTRILADADKDTAVVIVEFADPNSHAIFSVSERMHYYLIYEKVDAGASLADRDGFAWRIEIFDALRYDTLADARRRPYLMTREAWPEDEGRELISMQGLFRIQDALERFRDINGQYPFRLLGSDNRRDELISGGYLLGRYPDNGFNGGSMRSQEFGNKSSGDFAYYSVDADGDGWREGYWLLLHGKIQAKYIFEGYDTVLIMSNLPVVSQLELAQLFSRFWAQRAGEELVISSQMPESMPYQPPLSTLDPLAVPALIPDLAEAEPVLSQPLGEIEQLEPIEISPAPPQETELSPAEDTAGIEDTVVTAGPMAIEDAAVAGSETTLPEAASGVPTVKELLAVTCARLLSQDIKRHVNMLVGAEDALADAAEAETTPSAEPELSVPLTVYSFGW